jgi:uncharacterized protein DUF6191
MLDALQQLFAPGAQHTDHEKQRLDHTRVVEGHHDPGKGPIDLDSGMAVLLMALPPAVLPKQPRLEEEPGEPDAEPGPDPDLDTDAEPA